MKTQRLTADKLSIYIDKELAPRSIQTILAQASIESEGGYPLKESLVAIIKHLNTRADRTPDIEMKRRKDAAEAEAAEIKTARDRNELVSRADVGAVIKDVFTRQLETIKAADYIAPNHRERLAKEFREIKPDPLPE